MERQPDHRYLSLNKLYNIKNEDQIVYRLLRPGWLGKGDVETVLLRTSSGAESVVIRDNDTDHIKIKLQNLNEGIMDDNHRICWTKFEDADNFFLCVLISPTQIRVWDSSSIFAGGEGMLVHIPCEATSIFPLQLGIIIQRRISVEDQGYDEEEDLIFLSKERSKRTLLPSLYSLSHPLKNFLPIANSNVSESLVFVGNLDSMPIAMTYNIDTMQYAAWKIDPAASEIPFETTWDIDTVAPFLVHDIAITEEGFSSQTSITYNPSSTDALGLGRKKVGVDMLATLSMIQNDYSLMLLQEAMHCPSERLKLSNHVFAAGNAIYVCTGNELLIWRLIEGRFFVSATIPCSHALNIDLMPDSSSQFEPDIILLDHSLKLYRGENFVADVQLENMESITSIHDPVENRFTLVSRTGECCRVELDIILTPLIERVLSALHVSLGDVVPLRLRLECARLRLSDNFSASDDPSWSALSLILRQLLHNEEKRSSNNNDSFWNQLLNSSYPSSYEENFPYLDDHFPPEELVNNNFASVSPNTRPVDFENRSESAATKVKDVLFSLHQEFLLSLSTEPWCSLIETLCVDERLDSYVDKSIIHRHLDILYGEAQSRMSSSTPCIRSWITKCLAGHVDEYHFWPSTDRFSSVYPRLYLVNNVFSSMARQIRSNQSFDQSFDLDVVSCLLEAGITDQNFIIEDFTVGMALPIMEALLRCADRPNCEELSQLCTQTRKLIGREDIVDPDLVSNACARESNEYKDNTHGDEDGLVEIESSHALRFRVDNRLKEVGRLLRSSKPVYLKVTRAVEVSDHEYERLKQERLLILIRRVLALPLGRGMFTLGTLDHVPAENLPIPDLCLSGRVPPTNNIIALDTSQCPTDMTMWPSFHNGVAAGLRLPAAVEDASLKIARSWIIYNKTSSYGSEPRDEEISAIHAHGGVLMALGLRGHLSALSMTDVYEYLTQGSVTISVGMLLGMAANKRGTCDPSVSKMLCLHIPSLLPISFSSIDVSSPAHAAAVTGIGLLYQGSSHRLMTEFLLNEMGKRPLLDSSTVDREAYTLSCGLALGMITLGKGESGGSSGITDLEIEERLTRFIFGGVDNRANRRRQDLTDRKMNANGGTVSESERCSRIYEGEGINNDVTAPGALLALGLMYMKSG
jgi:Anaphase-promoting complex subunit 1